MMPETILGSAFFPWTAPIPLNAGDAVCVILRADLVGSDYVWGWETRVWGADGRPKVDFRQSTLFGVSRSIQSLRKRANTYVPTLGEDGEIDSFVLQKM